ncbi:unnamed protein product [Paramecium sonneborni]|uniref:Cyclic nucleotide-binding domain-containing protein n=1 Tax=Paramecium sonneborni TaxID=65129 RepID=A0A8S1PI37_9CILI|nr:unnamed protein product [Paramecium sonneborni]
MRNKRSLIQDQQPDHDLIRRQNEIILQPAIQVYKMYTQLHTAGQAEQVADCLTAIEFIQKQSDKNMKVRDFAMYAAQFFRYEHYNFGEAIMNQGDYGDRFYILLHGEVGVYIKRSIEDVQQDMDFITQQSSETNIGGNQQQKIKKSIEMPQLNRYDLAMKMLIENCMYFNNGIALFKKVWQYYSGQCFGDQALIHDQPRSASIIVVSDEAHLISMNKHDYKLICDNQIQEQNVKIEYFMKLFNGASKFTVSKFIQNLRTINFPSQTILWKEGEEPKFYILIQKGRVELYRFIINDKNQTSSTKKNKKIVLSQLSDNAFVGQEEIIECLPQRLYSCQVLDNTTAYYMESSEFNNLKKNFPEIVKLLKDKSNLIQDYMINRQAKIIQILQQQRDKEQIIQPQMQTMERKTIKEIFKNPEERLNKNDVRSQKPKLLLQSEITDQNMIYHQKKLPNDPKSKFLMLDKEIIDQIRDRVSRKIQTNADKKIRIKTTSLDDNQILINRVQSAVSTKSKRQKKFDNLDTVLQITSSEPNLISPQNIAHISSTTTIPIIQRIWNPLTKQLKARMRKTMSCVFSPNTIPTKQTESDEFFSYTTQPIRIHTGKSHSRKITSSIGSRKKSTQYYSFI